MEQIQAFISALSAGELATAGALLFVFLFRSLLQFVIVVTIPKVILLMPASVQIPFWLAYEVILNVSLLMDKFVSLLIPGRYWKPGRTISYRAGRWLGSGNPIAKVLCAILHPFDNNHCERAALDDDADDPLWWPVKDYLIMQHDLTELLDK